MAEILRTFEVNSAESPQSPKCGLLKRGVIRAQGIRDPNTKDVFPAKGLGYETISSVKCWRAASLWSGFCSPCVVVGIPRPLIHGPTSPQRRMWMHSECLPVLVHCTGKCERASSHVSTSIPSDTYECLPDFAPACIVWPCFKPTAESLDWNCASARVCVSNLIVNKWAWSREVEIRCEKPCVCI